MECYLVPYLSERLNPEEPGRQAPNIKEWMPPQPIKNLYCPIDGHYCEQPGCENCNFEKN